MLLSRLTCESCGFRPYSPPRWYGEVRRVRAGSGKLHISFLCEDCAGIDADKPLHGIEAEIALHIWLLGRRAELGVDDNTRREIYNNTMKPLNYE